MLWSNITMPSSFTIATTGFLHFGQTSSTTEPGSALQSFLPQSPHTTYFFIVLPPFPFLNKVLNLGNFSDGSGVPFQKFTLLFSAFVFYSVNLCMHPATTPSTLHSSGCTIISFIRGFSGCNTIRPLSGRKVLIANKALFAKYVSQ